MAVEDDALPDAIRQTLEKEKQGGQFCPAAWFKKHSGSHHATRALNMELKDIFQTLGYTWQQDIVPLTSSGLGRYAHTSDYEAFKPHFNALKKLFLNEKKTSNHIGMKWVFDSKRGNKGICNHGAQFAQGTALGRHIPIHSPLFPLTSC